VRQLVGLGYEDFPFERVEGAQAWTSLAFRGERSPMFALRDEHCLFALVPGWRKAVALGPRTVAHHPPPPTLPRARASHLLTMVDDVGNLDPATMSAAVDIDIFRNTFSGLYKFDNDLNEVADIADGQPTVSADGLTYTFKIKNNVKFSNGDPVTVDDFLFSWNRAAAMQGDYASVFAPVVGYDDVAGGKATEMSGLKKIDNSSFSATLSAPTRLRSW